MLSMMKRAVSENGDVVCIKNFFLMTSEPSVMFVNNVFVSFLFRGKSL